MSKISSPSLPKRFSRVQKEKEQQSPNITALELIVNWDDDTATVCGSFIMIDSPRFLAPPKPKIVEKPSPPLKRLLFSTAMSNTYIAEGDCGEEVVVKVLPLADRTKGYDPDLELRITSLAQLHPNAVRLLSVDKQEQLGKDKIDTDVQISLTLALANKGDLYEFLGEFKGERLPLEMARRCFKQVVGAVAHLHSLNISWRDAKPENVLVNRDNATGELSFFITDFGISEYFLYGPPMTETQTGTKQFSAPEVFPSLRRGTHFHAKKADVWSLGVLLYRILFGDIPPIQKRIFSNNPYSTYKRKRLMANPRPQRISFPRSADPQAKKLIKELLQFCPYDRPDLQQVLRHPFITQQED